MRIPRPRPVFPLTRRSAFLALVGVIYALVGYSYVTAEPSASLRASLVVVLDRVPLTMWGSLWIASGAFAVAAALARWGKRIAFAVLTATPVVWSGVWVIGWRAGDVERGWVQAISFGFFGLAVHMVAGMVNPPRRRQ